MITTTTTATATAAIITTIGMVRRIPIIIQQLLNPLTSRIWIFNPDIIPPGKEISVCIRLFEVGFFSSMELTLDGGECGVAGVDVAAELMGGQPLWWRISTMIG